MCVCIFMNICVYMLMITVSVYKLHNETNNGFTLSPYKKVL